MRENSEKNLPMPRFVHHETNMEWQSRELGIPAVDASGIKIFKEQIKPT